MPFSVANATARGLQFLALDGARADRPDGRVEFEVDIYRAPLPGSERMSPSGVWMLSSSDCTPKEERVVALYNMLSMTTRREYVTRAMLAMVTASWVWMVDPPPLEIYCSRGCAAAAAAYCYLGAPRDRIFFHGWKRYSGKGHRM